MPLQQAVSELLGEAQASLKQLEGRSGSGSRVGSRDSTPQPTARSTSQAEQPSGSSAAAAEAGAAGAQAAGQPCGMSAEQERTQQPAAAAAQQAGQQAAHEGMVLVAVLLCTLLRGCRLQGHKARVVSLLCDAAAYCDDETRLQRVLPYLVAATAEPLAAVRVVALRAITRVLAQVGTQHGEPGAAPVGQVAVRTGSRLRLEGCAPFPVAIRTAAD